MSAPEPTDPTALAGEYVLGLLDAQETAAAERRLIDDPVFAEEVSYWRWRLGALDESAPPAPLPPGLWARIAGQAFAPPAPQRRTLAELWASLAFWRGFGLASATAALVLALATGHFAREAGRQPQFVAILMTETNEAAMVVDTFADGRAVITPLQRLAPPSGKAIQIWTLWDRSVGPRSLGVVDGVTRRLEVRLDGLPGVVPGQLFEMTLEPEKGSPTGRPTGPILNKGTAARAL